MKNTMKILMLFLCFFLAKENYAQVPGMNYQATVRNAAGELMVNENVTVIFDLREMSATGASVYNETHTLTTNDYGGFAAIVGEGTVNSGNYVSIDWGTGFYFLNVNVDGEDLGTSKFQHVPFAHHASSADYIKNPLWDRDNPDAIYTTEQVIIGNGQNDEELLTVVTDDLGSASELVDFRVETLSTNKDVLNLQVGVASTFNAQFIECRYENDVNFKVDVDGTTLVNEINTTPTGDANLVPIAYGIVQGNGNIYTNGSTNNFSVSKTSTGFYVISVNNQTMNFSEYMVQVTPHAAIVDPIISNYAFPGSGINNGNLFIYSYRLNGLLIDNAFSFMIYKL